MTSYLDSELIVKQIKGEYKVKNENLKQLYNIAKTLIAKIPEFEIIHIKRALNKKADALVNAAIDNKQFGMVNENNTSNNESLKLKELKAYLKKLKKCVIAYSGGVDSTFLLKVAKDVLDENVIAVTINAFMHTDEEVNEAVKTAKDIGAKHIVLDLKDFVIQDFFR